MTQTVRCVVDAKASLGESTYWDADAQVLWWIDIYSRLIHRTDPASGRDEVFEAPDVLGCVAARQSGGLVLTMKTGFGFFDPPTGKFTPIVDPERDVAETRFNDGKTDRRGRFWSGSMFEAPGKERRSIGALYRLDADLSCHRVIEGVGCSNGLAWSPDDRTMYFADSFTPYVWAFDFDAAYGSVANRRVFVDLSSIDGVADGATVDADGCYWVTIPFKGKVQRYDPDGRLMHTIEMPTDLPTCCEFGGADLGTLFVTTAVLNRGPEQLRGQANPGGLFAVDAGARGLKLRPFAG